MQIDNMGGRLTAIVTAAALGAGGTSLLFGDVFFGDAAFTQKHFQTICIVIATTTAWMAMTSAFKKRHVVAGFGFLVLALAGSCVIGWNSLGRQTEGQMLSADDHDKAVEKRGELSRKKADAEQTLVQRQKEADAECKTGEGSKCRGARAVVEFWTGNVAGFQAQLDALKVKPADASAEAFGNLTNAIGGNGTKAKALSMLLMPIAITILFEFGFTMALHYVFRPVHAMPTRLAADRPALPALPAPTQLATVSDADLSAIRAQFVEADSPSRRPDGPRNGGARTVRRNPDGPPKTGGMSKREALQHVLTELALGRSVPSQQTLANLSGYDKRRVSEWYRDWERGGLIPARTTSGRCKSLVAG